MSVASTALRFKWDSIATGVVTARASAYWPSISPVPSFAMRLSTAH